LVKDVKALELRGDRTFWELRATFRSLALAGGADDRMVDLITHPNVPPHERALERPLCGGRMHQIGAPLMTTSDERSQRGGRKGVTVGA
jgi:hypothetical protein